MLDKILLVLLILLLPLGILASRQLLKISPNGATRADVTEKQITDIIQKLNEQVELPPQTITQMPTLNVTAVTYASGAGVLKVAGVAPSGTVSITVTAAVLPPETIPELNTGINPDVLGQTVTIKAVKPQSDGSFTYEYPVKDTLGIVEINLIQGNAHNTIQYDLQGQKRLI